MRWPWVCLFLFSVLCPSMYGQSSGLGGGIYLLLGVESTHNPGVGSPVTTGLVGGYVEWLRPAVHPGLDVRGSGNTLGLQGTLVGPRASVGLGSFHPYAEFLAGPNHADYQAPGVTILQPNQLNGSTDREGVTVQGVVGVDADISEHFRWRVLEFSQSRFSGISGSRPSAFTTGIVLRFR